MSMNPELIHESIMRDMAQGIVIIDMEGMIVYANPAAERILGHGKKELLGQSFAECSFCFEGNASFNQTMLDAVYGITPSYRGIIPYFTEGKFKKLYISTSYLKKKMLKITKVLHVKIQKLNGCIMVTKYQSIYFKRI